MKRFLIILVLLVYSTASIGATVHLHYCMNKFSGWNLFGNEKDKECSKCGMTEKKGGCCKEEHKKIKIEDDHQKSSLSKYVYLIAVPVTVALPETNIFKATCFTCHATFSNAPPHIPKRLHLLNCVFLI